LASAALAELQSRSHRVLVSANDGLTDRYGSGLPLAEAFDRQERELASSMRQAIALPSPSESV
jgi:cell division GTPase FtsZ